MAPVPQARRPRRRRVGSGGPPAVGEERAHQRRGEGRARGHLEQPVPLDRSDRGRAGRPRRARQGRRVDPRRAHAAADQPRQGAVPRQVGPGWGQGADQARPHPAPRGDGAGHAPVPGRPARQPPPLPRRHRQARLLAQGGAVARAGLDHPLALRGPRPRRDRVVLRRRLARRARLDGELRRHRAAPVDVHGGRAPPADLGDDRHRPGGQGDLRRRARAGAPVPHRARPPRRGGVPEGHRQARHPDLGARRRRATRSRTPARGWSGCRAPSATPSPTS